MVTLKQQQLRRNRDKYKRLSQSIRDVKSSLRRSERKVLPVERISNLQRTLVYLKNYANEQNIEYTLIKQT